MADSKTLVGLKKIAEHEQAHVTTIMRWIRTRGYPVIRRGRKWATTTGCIDQWYMAQHLARLEREQRAA